MSLVNKIRCVFYGGIILYILAEFWVMDGPLRRWRESLSNRSDPQASSADHVARVADKTISKSQLDRAISEQLWLQGKVAENLAPEEFQLARAAALDELIERELLQIQAQALAPQLVVSDATIDERLRRLLGRFESKDALESAMKSQGVATEMDLRERLTDQIRQEKLIELRIGPFIQVTDEEARKWFAENPEAISLPERVEVRHIFIPAMDHPLEESHQKLQIALAARLAHEKDLATLAKELSEDPATKDNGGNLGWMARDRLPADFADPVFLLDKNQPALIQTKLGWHLVEVTDRKAAEPALFQDAEPEIRAALAAVKRRQAVKDFRKQLRQSTAVRIW